MKKNNIVSSYALNAIQNGILFEVASNNVSLYIVQMLLRIKGEFDVQLFWKAYEKVIERHEMLRSAIALNEESACYQQVVHKNVQLKIDYIDLSRVKFSERLQQYNRFLSEDFICPLDLLDPPLMRIVIFRFSKNDHRIVWTRHHVLMDGNSAALILKEIFTLYFAYRENNTVVLPTPVTSQQVQELQNVINLDVVQRYWKKSLKNLEESGTLPFPLNPAKNIKTIDRENCVIDGNEFRQLLEFTDEHRFSINTLLQGAWGILLSHYCNKKQVVFGSVRAYPKNITENAVGVFINTLPVSLCIDPQLSILSYLKLVRKQAKYLRENVYTPLKSIREWNEISLNTLLYQTIIDYKPYSLSNLLNTEFSQLNFEASFRLDVPYPLILEVVNEGNYLRICLQYAADLFEQRYINNLLCHFKSILTKLCGQFEKKLLSISALTRYDFLHSVVMWNDTRIEYPLYKTIHQVFEEQVEKAPNSIAVVYDKWAYTYKEVNEKANQLSHYLIASGITDESIVGIYLRPSLDMIVSILAVLKAGCAYLPLDINYPVNRISYMLQNSLPKAIIKESSNAKLSDTLSKMSSIKEINIDKSEWTKSKKSNPKLPISSNNLCYIIYTSGSTGNPKGVSVEHHSVVNMAMGCIEKLKITPQSRVLQIAAFSFDVSVAEMNMALLSGARLYLTYHEIFSIQAIAEALKRLKITNIILASSILAAIPQDDYPHLKVIAVGGEPCSQALIDFWAQNRLFFNVYGITETTVCTTMHPCFSSQEKILIGKPLPNTQVYILNENLQPSPIGVPGEIYIGGEGVARGYHNNPQLTQERFIINPFRNTSKLWKYLYKTGDIGRWHASGDLECLGRLDNQLKIYGFRIELGEIEKTIEKHPSVLQACVLVSQNKDMKQIYAYVVAKNNNIIPTEVLNFLQKNLPNHMLPDHIVPLAEMPLTPNGKIDKVQLSQIKINKFERSSDSKTDASDYVKKGIESIVEFLLQIKNVPSEKNFFDIGFDSVKLYELLTKLNKNLNLNLDILKLFRYSNIKLLSDYIEKNNAKKKYIKNFEIKNNLKLNKEIKPKKFEFFNERSN